MMELQTYNDVQALLEPTQVALEQIAGALNEIAGAVGDVRNNGVTITIEVKVS